MEPKTLLNIQILPNYRNPVFEQRESGITHTSFVEETTFYSFIQCGNVDMINRYFENYIKKGIVIGHLSNDSLRQMQYWAVCCITLGTRYAIQGGLDEMTAYNLSDSYIMNIDKMVSGEEITEYLMQIVLELTTLVRDGLHPSYSHEIRKCVNYINKHLHEKLTLNMLATEINYSKAHLTKTFKKQVGVPIGYYILAKKIEEAKILLLGDSSQKMIAYYLGFCSQTHFIQSFKKLCGITPNQFKTQKIHTL